jgi:TetR/AcrR family transcriptional repressor of nem operon
MARPRKFDEREVVQKAMMAFWQTGFEGTTMKALQGATGVDGKGLSNVFNDKEQLFLKTLDAYTEMYRAALQNIFATPSISALEAFFSGLANDDVQADDPVHNGCLMVNTVVEFGAGSPAVKQKVERYRQMFILHFTESLAASEVSEPSDKAELLLGLLWGALTQIRLAGNKSAAKPMALQILKIIGSWKA